MKNVAKAIVRYLSPGGLAGISFSNWMRLLIQNRFQISPQYWPRAAILTIFSPVTSFFGFLEDRIYSSRWDDINVPPPLFILGGWRSGTTHLHNLFAVDPRFAYSNLYETMYPDNFLLSDAWWRPIMSLMTPRKRFQDNVRMGMLEPAQDEMALSISTLKSSMLGWVFPNNADLYDPYLTFENVSREDIECWEKGFRKFVRKLTYKYRRPLVLKSPYHTARIRLLLELFPDAKFVHIHRHPYDVYPSFCHTLKTVIPSWAVQRLDESTVSEKAIRMFRTLYDAFFEQVSLISKDCFCEISYNDLESDALGTMKTIYDKLRLPEFEEVRPAIADYLASLSGYKKNRYSDLPEEIKQRLRSEWKACFENWGYSTC